jgi:uncharacterized delta-60 repeat protein
VKRLAAIFAFALISTVALRAQDTWSVASSPTAQSLWGVAWGNNLFVAVGEAGTVLTSSDGSSWALRTSGTTAWLVGVGYANNQFVAVGDKGMLLTSTDGLAWTPRASGTTERLNAVAFGNGRWLAVGENRAAVTSPDGRTWTPAAIAVFSPGWLRGLCFGYGSFVATGEAGRIVTTADAAAFFSRSLATSAYFEAVTYARRTFVAVGAGGLVLTAPDAATWRGNYAPAPMRAVAFFNNVFVGAAANGSILTSPDGTVWTARPTGNSSPLFALAGSPTSLVAVGMGGTILRSTAAQAAPAIVTPPASLTEAVGNNVLLSVVATGTAPLTYQWSLNGQPLAGATADALTLTNLQPAHAGRYTVIASNTLGSATSAAAVLTVVPTIPAPTEIFDPAFAAGATPPHRVNAMLALPDGKVLVGGGFDSPSSFSVPTQMFIARYNPDGTRDSGFVSTAPLYQHVTQLVLQPDGKILVVNSTIKLHRLNPDGSLDATFASAEISVSPTPTASERINLSRAAVLPDGRILVAGYRMESAFFIEGRGYLARLLANGSADPSFTVTAAGNHIADWLGFQPEGRILLVSRYASFPAGGRWSLERLNADGTPDLSFVSQGESIGRYPFPGFAAATEANGNIVIARSLLGSYWRVSRFRPDGTDTHTLAAADTDQRFYAVTAVAPLPDGRVVIAGAGSSPDVPVRLNRLVARNIALPAHPPVIISDLNPRPITVPGGDTVTLHVSAAGTAPLTTVWIARFAGADTGSPLPSSDPTGDTALTLANVRSTATYYANVSNAAGSVVSPAIPVNVTPRAPSFASAPVSISASAGHKAILRADVAGSGPLAYQWFFNGVPVRDPLDAGVDPITYSVAASVSSVGTYQLVIRNALGTIASDLVTLSIDPRPRLANLGTRGFVGTGEASMITGFVISGRESKHILIRGIGPGLAQFGVTRFLADPKIVLFDAKGVRLAENDNATAENATSPNWFGNFTSFKLAFGTLDAVINTTLPPGNYTVQVTGVNDTTGIALAEVYENNDDDARLVNVSTRLLVGTGEAVAIPGVVINGPQSKRILVRAVGPTLALFGVGGTLVDPQLTLVDGNGFAVAANDNWTAAPNATELAAAAASAGAFALPADSKDAALLVSVPPGSYTALVSGIGGTTGVALVEVYEVP